MTFYELEQQMIGEGFWKHAGLVAALAGTAAVGARVAAKKYNNPNWPDKPAASAPADKDAQPKKITKDKKAKKR